MVVNTAPNPAGDAILSVEAVETVPMPPLDATKRARLPDRAFAYVDSKGRRRLPINDESHVRNALARFNQTRFEDEAAKEEARRRLLRAAKKYGIVPLGFFARQLQSRSREADAGRLVVELGSIGQPADLEPRLRSVLGDPSLLVVHWSESVLAYLDGDGRLAALPSDGDGRAVTLLERGGRPMTALIHDPAVLGSPDVVATVTAAVRLAVENDRLHGEVEARARDAYSLPTGLVTFVMTDIEGSTGLLDRLGDRYAALLADVRRVHRSIVRAGGGREIDARGDEYFAVFGRPAAALASALEIRRRLRDRAWPDEVGVRVRVGIHSGHPTLTETGYVGLAVHTASRIGSAAHGDQILLSMAARDAIEGSQPAGIGFRSLGDYLLRGLTEPDVLFQVVGPDLTTDFPAPRSSAASPVPAGSR
jgi:class 3 adenylate cyclase